MAIENIYERCHVMAKMKLPVKDTLKDQLKVPPCLGAHPPTASQRGAPMLRRCAARGLQPDVAASADQ